jgi:hypothetical protein
MKRIVFAFVCVALVSLTAKAESVSRSDAFNTAQQYLLSKGKILNQSRTPFRAARNVDAQPESAYYYVFNAEGGNGYVIVSGDDRTPEILGYVENGSFDEENIPENMKSWLQSYVDQIKYLVDNDVTIDRRVLKARANARGTRHSIPVMLTSRWNQGKPYNITCPNYYLEDDKNESTALPLKTGPAAGCVATAMAQVVNFYKYPAKLKAAIPSYSITYKSEKNGSTKTVTQKTIPKNTIIDWDNIRDTYSWEDGHVANAQDSAVANLMHMCGQAVKMHYGPSSGAVTANSKDVFINMFGFDDSAYWVDRSSCSIDEWFNLIYDELAAGYPVLFNGHSSGGGHAFVLDGFDGEQLFHVNWGWGGGSDGWFLVGILNPGDTSGIGASSSSDGYSMGQGALFNLRLPDNVRTEKSTCMTINDIKVSGTTISGKFLNWTGATNSFNTGIVKINDDNTVSLVGTSQTITDMSKDTYYTKNFNIKGRLQPGTYRLSPASKLTSNKIWRPELDLKRSYILAEVDSAKNMTLTYVVPIEDISVDTIVFPGTRAVNEEQEIKVTFRNHADEFSHTCYLYVGKTQVKEDSKSRSLINIREGGTTDVSFFYKPTETGTYNIWICRNSDGTGVLGQTTMEVVSASQAKKASLSVTGFTIQNSANNVVYGNKLVGTVTIRNTGKEKFSGNVKLQLWRQPKGSSVAWSSTATGAEMTIEPSKSATASFQFNNLNYDDTYHIAVSNSAASISSGGIWDHKWVPTSGVLYWKNNGLIFGQASKAAYSAPTTAIATYVNGISMSRFVANKNPNTIYYFKNCTRIPIGTVTDANMVIDGHADVVNFYSENPYYIPENFDADTAYFHYTFPADGETDIAWQAITLPFAADSISRGDFAYQLNDSLNHFWIYEFMAIDDDGTPIFEPANELRANTPYIIACDSMFRGLTITFIGNNQAFYSTGSDKMIISSDTYNMYGSTYQPSLKNVFMLNADGTAFEYVTKATALPALSAYFTSKLAEEEPAPIILPFVPNSTAKVAGWGDVNQDEVLDEADAEVLAKTLVLKAPEGTGIEYGDVDGDGRITIADLVRLINQVYK